jgi:coproporphyrinogen III oxidase-like Fe-S oxidoreductase
MAITGNGNASKEQVAKMLQQLLGLKELPKISIQLMDWQQQFVIFLIQERWLELKAILVGMHLLNKMKELKMSRNLYTHPLLQTGCHYCDFFRLR